MSTVPTARDHIWHTVLATLGQPENEYVTATVVSDMVDDEATKRAVQYTLWAMHDLGVLEVDERPGSEHRWYIGPEFPTK